MKTVVIHASADDVHAEAVARCLHELGSDSCILFRERCFRDWNISSECDEVIIDYGHARLRAPNDVSAVFWRRDHIAEPAWIDSPNISPPVAEFLADQRSIHVESAFRRLALTCRFLNKIDANRSCSSKSLQHHVARKCGLAVPRTYIGSDPVCAEAFARQLWRERRRCCTKNIESTLVEIDGVKHSRLTKLFSKENVSDLSGLPICPMIFQEYIEKRFEYRVTVVGQEVFSCRIDSQVAGGATAIDWRNYNIPSTPHHADQLNEELTRKLVALTHKLGLTYGAIDLIEDLQGEFYFLEVNSMGQWLWIEDLTEMPISMAIARHLASPALIRT